MDNKFENHVKSDKVKWIVVFLALILLAVGLLSVSTDGFKALRRDKSPVDSTEIPVEDEGGGSVLTEGKSNGMKLAGAKLTSEEYEANGVSEQADSVYTITATVTPANVTDPTVLWTAEWTNGASAWASGKAVTEYLSLTPSANTLTATLVCKKEFGEQAIITAKAKSNEDAAASCTVDYVKRVTSVSITAPSKIAFSSSETSYTVLATPNYGTGTLTPDTFTITGGTLVKNVKTTNAVHKSVTNSSAGTITTYTRSAVEKDLTFSGNTINVYIKLNLIVTLTATVEPKNATNQEVDWSVQWSENAALKNNAVTDYVTVTPISDGNRTAKVTCKRAFGSDTILIIVTTRDGGFTAQCSATFKGAPIRVTGVTLDDTLEF